MEVLMKTIVVLMGTTLALTAIHFISTPDECSYENLYTYAPETLIAPEPSHFAAEIDYFRAAIQYHDNGTWATLESGEQCKFIN